MFVIERTPIFDFKMLPHAEPHVFVSKLDEDESAVDPYRAFRPQMNTLNVNL